VQLQDSAAQGGLAAAGLTYQAQGLALVDIQGNTVVGAHIPLFFTELGLFYREVLLHIAEFQQYLFLLILHSAVSPPFPHRSNVPDGWGLPRSGAAPPPGISGCSTCSGAQTCSPWAGTGGWAPHRGWHPAFCPWG